MRKIVVLIASLTAVIPAKAQSGLGQGINALETVYLSDQKLDDFSIGQSVQTLSDSVLLHNRPRLTELLQYNTPIYFKENGRGMVSSAAFRGTTAAQTAVLWNGININSNFNGQMDFNTINAGNYDNIQIRPGGGSLIYGSSAIGGTVHLNTLLHYTDEFTNRLHLGYGSYNTRDARYRLRWSSRTMSLRVSVGRNSSDNDYKLKGREGHNTNGQYHSTAYNLGLGVRLDKRNKLTLYSGLFKGNRHFPIYYLSENKTRYKDFNTRNLLQWESRFGQFKSQLSAALLTEKYRYYPRLNTNHHTYGKTKTLIGKYDLQYRPTDDLQVDAFFNHRYTEGSGSDIHHEVRNISSVGFLFKHQLTGQLRYQLGGRKEMTHSYGSPFLYDLGIDYDLTSFYTVKLSASRNYRRPTFNDLYWTDSGNPDLDAEESKQIEWGNQFVYRSWKLTVDGYFNAIEDLIHWIPQGNGLSTPRNEERVQSYGTEIVLRWKKQFGKHRLLINGTYGYTISENQDTKKQLIYVPYHKATSSVTYSFGRFSMNYQLLYNGQVYTHSDNDPQYTLGDYLISNLGLNYEIGKNNTFIIGGKVRNFFDKTYQNVQRFEMPGIHCDFFITLNF